MKSHLKLITHKLEAIPKFRERSRKNIGLATIVAHEFGFTFEFYDDRVGAKFVHSNGSSLDQNVFINMLTTYATMDRAWRKVMKDNPNLRGTDYSKKTKLVQDKLISLEYQPGFNQIIKENDEKANRENQ
jgi:hypothetical protein